MRILGDLSFMKPRHAHYPSNPQPNIAYREGLMKPYYLISFLAMPISYVSSTIIRHLHFPVKSDQINPTIQHLVVQ
nr:hypothetical protein Iba_chr07cCG3000 [Ipomoea batatas]